MKPTLIPDELNDFTYYDLEGLADETLAKLNNIVSDATLKGYSGLYFSIYSGYDGYSSLKLYGLRIETAKETSDREAREASEELKREQAKLKAEEKEKQEYLRLKQKYEV